MKRIYMDNSATTAVAPEVLEAMLPYFEELYGNASSLHAFGREARAGMEEARERVASLIGAEPEEVYFTSGGTESDNLALKGIALRNRAKGRHIITTTFEHPAVLEVCRGLEALGFEVTYLPVTGEGLVEPDALEKAIGPETILISVMHANNEVGTIQPLKEIGEIAKEKEIYFHSDAVQTAGKIPLDVDSLGLDLASISGHKLYGPKGVGALYIRKGAKIESIVQGGGHESGLRSGTENVPGIVGLGQACALAKEAMAEETERLTRYRDGMIDFVLSHVDDSWLNGHPRERLPSNVNLGFGKVEGESLLLYLDARGIAVSTGSACSSRKLQPSHVLTAIGLAPERCHGSLRITLGRYNTEEEVDYASRTIVEAAERFSQISAIR
ncbi:MAG: cysteine desulfurase [Methanotrichaceae archaeon]|nr:cysteine desulfurase [Methanotrichaceae archaeon]